MPITTDLSRSPYFDDLDETKDFARVLFKPGFAVQTRELNQMQSLLQQQVERMGDAVFETGTVIDGCNFQFFPEYAYVKIKDSTVSGLEAVPSQYVGLFAQSTATGLRAFVTDYADGFEASSPDLKTMFLHYNSAGADGNTFSFSPGETLTVTDANGSVFSISVTNTGIGYTNADFVVVTPSVAVTTTSGTFSNGDYVTQPTTGANLQVIGVDADTLADSGQVVLRLAARSTDLSAQVLNATAWALANSDSIINASNTAVGTVDAVFGTGAEADVVTDASGRIVQSPVVSGGWGYRFQPTAQVRSANNASVTSAVMVAQNWLANVVIANTASAVGNGYAFGVSAGVVYQKGHFLRVEPQSIVVSKYSTTPSNVTVVFSTTEDVVTSFIDTSLLDNSLGSENHTAPGADRLRLRPRLALSTPDDQSSLTLVAWSEGLPYKQNQATAFSRVGDAIAQAVSDTSGDFSLDLFQTTTRSPVTQADEGSTISIVVDPGVAYVDGRRVETVSNFVLDVDKGVDVAWSNNRSVTLAYGDWVRVDQLGGTFQFSTGDQVSLYGSAKGYLSNLAAVQAGNLTPVGSVLGTARVRSLAREAGVPGQANTTYRMYLFDVVMNSGRSFRSVKSVAYLGTRAGVADVALEPDPTTGASIAVLHDTQHDALVFDLGADALKSANNVDYTYRTIDQTVAIANTGLLTKSLTGSADEFFAHLGAPLSSASLGTLDLSPTIGLRYSTNVAGTVTANGTSPNLVGSGTTFLSSVVPGDYLLVYANATTNDVRRVVSVVNNTVAVLDANCDFSQAGVAAYRYFPAGVAIPLGSRDGLTGNVDSNGNILTIDLGGALSGTTSANATLAYDVRRVGAAPATKSATRSRFVKLRLANNAGGVAGPWCLGVPDVIRLRGVWVSNSTTVNVASQSALDEFYADGGQDPSFVDLGYLYKNPGSSLALDSNTWLLASLDYLTTTGTGYYDATSYVSANAAQAQAVDSTPLANLGTSVASLEVPEVYDTTGRYWDLLGSIDFRPIAANTAAPATNSSSAPVNPPYALSFGNTADPTNDKKFPSPGSVVTLDVEQYAGRVDSVFVGHDGGVFALRGVADVDPTKRRLANAPRDSMRINDVGIPPWPTVPVNFSTMQAEVAVTRVKQNGRAGARLARKTATPRLSVAQVQTNQPRRYSMADVGKLEDRINALEYYTSLSALETDMTKRVIPSSSNTAVDRFKFGFFVDDFSSSVSQATDDPQYSATVGGGVLKPPAVSWTVSHGGSAATLPWVEWALAGQDGATLAGANATTNAVTVTTNATVTVLNTYSWALSTFTALGPPTFRGETGDITGPGTILAQYEARVGGGGFDISRVDRLRFGENSGQATLYFYVPPTAAVVVGGADSGGTGGDDPVAFLVYQQNVLVADAGTDAVALTAADRQLLTSASGPSGGRWFPASFVTLLEPLVKGDAPIDGHFTLHGAGKVSWNHTAEGGQDYTVISNLLNLTDSYYWALRYPSGQVVTSTSVPVATAMSKYSAGLLLTPPVMTLELDSTNPTANVGKFLNGSTTINGGAEPGWVTTGLLDSRVRNATPSARASLRPQSFSCTAWGLMPGARHKFYVGEVDKSARCRPTGGTIGDPLTSGVDGSLAFTFYYDATVDQDVTVQLVSNTAALALGGAGQLAAAGAVTLSLRAPNSTTSYSLPVYDLNVPLGYLTK